MEGKSTSEHTSTREPRLWNKCKVIIQSFVLAAKKVLLFITKIVTSVALLSFMIIPFLHGILPDLWAYITWGISSGIFIVDSLVAWHKHRNEDKQDQFWSIFSRGSSISIFVLFAGLFVANYFDTPFTWHLALALFAAVNAPISFSNFRKLFEIKNQYTEEQIKQSKQNVFKFTLFYWLIISFLVAVHCQSLLWQFISGGLALVILFTNLAGVVLADKQVNKYLAVHDLLAGVALTVYLIYIIPNATVQNIVLVVVAALYGGLMTLVGVAWTIKDGQRKEQESKRLEKIPYLQASLGQWIVREKRESVFPELWLNLTRSDNENCVSSGFSIEITNIGLGLADNLGCTWHSGETSCRHFLSCTLLQCNESFSVNAIVDAERKEQTSYMDAMLVFEFDDLLANHYSQALSISFQVEYGYIKPTTYKMSAPVYIGRSQEVKNA